MCGIGGFSLFSESSLTKTNLKKILNNILHRGPDDKGIYEDIENSVGLAHSRLSIQDLSSSGHQPMVSDDQRLVLVFNGEIYNFLELRSELISEGIKFKSHSDTEVLLQLYMKYGRDMLSRLNGIFAFALWDKNAQTLLLSRDNFGVKPLYYLPVNNSFYFASEIKALIPFLNNLRVLNPESIQNYLTFLYCPGKGTPFKSVNKLLPGEAMIVKKGKIEKKWKWYQLPIFQNKNKKFLSKINAIDGVRDHLRKAIHRQLVSDVPVGAFLSGGLDSSSIVSFAKEKNRDIKCFTIETQGENEKNTTDDLHYAHKVAKYLEVELNVVQINSSKIANDIELMIKTLDEPIADPAALNVLYISRLAKEQGIKVLLSGAGGDDIFTGYRRHNAVSYENIWTWLPLRLRLNLKKFSAKLNQTSTIKRRLTKLLSGVHLNENQRLLNYFKWIQREDLQKLYSPEFNYNINQLIFDSEIESFLDEVPPSSSKLDRMLALEQQFFLADHNLLYTDRMSMAEGVEVRVPFLDKELVEFAYNIPDNYKQRGNVGKWILKKALEGHLPKDVIYRPKTGFGVPLRKWINNELKELLRDMLSFDSLKSRGIFNPRAVMELMSDNDKGRIDASYTLLSILCIEIWMRNYIKK